MKKIIIALMCATMTLATSAQPANCDKACQDKPKQECCGTPCQTNAGSQCRRQMPMACQMKQKTQRQGMSDMVINMQAIRSIGLDSTKVQAVKELKRKKAGEMREMLQAMRPAKPEAPAAPATADKKDKKSDKKKIKKEEKGNPQKDAAAKADDRKAQRQQFMAKQKENREKMQAFMKGYRSELRTLLGDEKYIEYLEKLATQRQQPQKWQQPRQHKHRGARR